MAVSETGGDSVDAGRFSPAPPNSSAGRFVKGEGRKQSQNDLLPRAFEGEIRDQRGQEV